MTGGQHHTLLFHLVMCLEITCQLTQLLLVLFMALQPLFKKL
jgi:hypothetical protein